MLDALVAAAFLLGATTLGFLLLVEMGEFCINTISRWRKKSDR